MNSQRISDVKNESGEEIINLANKEVENIFDNQKLAESLPNAANNDVVTENDKNEEASNSFHSDSQGELEELIETTTLKIPNLNDIQENSRQTSNVQTFRLTKNTNEVVNRNVESATEYKTFDDDKIFIKSTASVESKKKQILWKSEDISATENQRKPKSQTLSGSRKLSARKLPKHFKKRNENDDIAPPITVDLPNIDNIANFATVIERNDTEGVVQRTVIIKNSPAAFQAFGIKNVPKNVLSPPSPFQEKNDVENLIVTRNPNNLNEGRQNNLDFIDNKEETTTIRNEDEEDFLIENTKEAIEKKTNINFLSDTKIEDDETSSIITTTEDSLAKKSQENLLSVKQPLQSLTDNKNFKVIERNDTDGNIKRIVIIKNTPEALKTFGIKNIPKKVISKEENEVRSGDGKLLSNLEIPEEPKSSFHLIDTPQTPEFNLIEELDEVFNENDPDDESEEVFTNDIFSQNPESSISTDFIDQKSENLQSFNPLRKLNKHLESESSRSSNLELQKDAEVNVYGTNKDGKEESETLKTLFYEDFSHELTDDKSPLILTSSFSSSKEDLFTEEDFDYTFNLPNIETINIGPVLPNKNIVDNFKLRLNDDENRNPKEIKDEVIELAKDEIISTPIRFEESLIVDSELESNFESTNQGNNGLVIFPETTSGNFESPTIDLGLISSINTFESDDDNDSPIFIPSTLDHQEDNLIKVSPVFQTSATKSENDENHPRILSSLDQSDSLAQFAQEVNLVTSDGANLDNQPLHNVHNFNSNQQQQVNSDNSFNSNRNTNNIGFFTLKAV